MPIQFNCTQCQKRLSVPDGSAGKQAACPSCGARVTIPDVSAPAGLGNMAPPLGPVNPFAEQSPYQSPLAPRTSTAPRSGENVKILGPSIGMMAGAGLSLLIVLARLIMGIMTDWPELEMAPPQGDPAQEMGFYVGMYGGLIVVFGVTPVLNLVTLIGAFMMMARRRYAWAMAGSVIAILPCSCCFPLTLPFGIWAIISLLDPKVKAIFH